MTWPPWHQPWSAPHSLQGIGRTLDSPRPHRQGHHHAPADAQQRQDAFFQSIISWACSNISSSTRECQPACTRKAGRGERGDQPPGPKRRAPADHWSIEVQGRNTRSGRWGGWLLRVLRLATLSKKQPQNLNPVLQHNTLTARNRGRKKRKIYFQKIAAHQVKNCDFTALPGATPQPQLRR